MSETNQLKRRADDVCGVCGQRRPRLLEVWCASTWHAACDECIGAALRLAPGESLRPLEAEAWDHCTCSRPGGRHTRGCPEWHP